MSYAPRRWWRTATLMFGAFLLAAMSLSAQYAPYNYPCWGDCPVAWGPANTVTLTLPGGCLVRVVYVTRNGCGNDDFAILAVEPLTAPCSGLSNAGLINLATQALLLENATGIPPYAPDDCDTVRRIIPGCWGYRHNPCSWNDSLLVPCDTTNCCITFYEVCNDSVGDRRTVRRLFTVGGGGDTCATQLNGTWRCVPVCDDTSLTRPHRRDPHLGATPELRRDDAPQPSAPPTSALRRSESAIVPARPVHRNR